MGANSTASTRLLNPHGTPRCSVCLQYLEKLKTDGHKKIKEITCDSADLKKDSLEKDEVAFLVLVKYSNTASFPPVCRLWSLSEQEYSRLLNSAPTGFLNVGHLARGLIHLTTGHTFSKEAEKCISLR